MAKGIKRKIDRVQKKVQEQIAANASGGRFAAGISSEGFDGGYAAALSDVRLALDGVYPCSRYARYWEEND